MSHSRPTVLYGAQSSPSEGSRNAAASADTRWLGPFERVLGDHDEPGTERRTPSSASNPPNYGQSEGAVESQVRTLDDKGNENAGAVSRPPVNSSTERPSPRRGQSSQQKARSQLFVLRNDDFEDMSRRSPHLDQLPGGTTSGTHHRANDGGDSAKREKDALKSAVNNENHKVVPQHLHPISHKLASKGSNRSLRSTAHNAAKGPSSATTSIRSYAAQPTAKAGGPDQEVGCFHPSTGIFGPAHTLSGPRTLQIYSQNEAAMVSFTDLYLNHAPGLHPIRLQNPSSSGQILLVRLESGLGRAVSFLRRKRSGAPDEMDTVIWPSNTLRWAQQDGLSPSKLRDLRNISTNLEIADSLILESGATTDVFIVFRPNLMPTSQDTAPLSDSQSETASSGTPHIHSPHPAPIAPMEVVHLPSSSSTPDHDPSPSSSLRGGVSLLHPFTFSASEGSVVIRSWPLPSLQKEEIEASDSNTSGNHSASTSRPASIYSTGHSSSAISTAHSVAELASVDHQVIELPFKATFCRPQFAVNVRHPFSGSLADSDGSSLAAIHRQGNLIVDFGDVPLGRQESTELTLINQSDISCFWQGRIDGAHEQDARLSLSLGSVDNADKLDIIGAHESGAQYRPNTLSPRAMQKIQLSVSTDQLAGPGNAESIVTLTNLHNTTNCVRIVVRANIVNLHSSNQLSIESGRHLDFGDCCGGQWTRQLLVLRNSGEHALDVALSAQKGFEVTFEQAQMAIDSEDGEDIAIGATAASSDRNTSASETSSSASEANSAPSDPAPSIDEGSYLRAGLPERPINSHANTIAELLRTPTHHAFSPAEMGGEPPTFDLATSQESAEMADLERTPLVLTPYAHPPAPQHKVADDEDEDNSSVASQAGSRPTSPTQPSVISEIETNTQSGSEAPSSVARSDGFPRNHGAKTSSVLAWREASRTSPGHSVPPSPTSKIGSRSNIPLETGLQEIADSSLRKLDGSGASDIASQTGDRVCSASESGSQPRVTHPRPVQSVRALSTSSAAPSQTPTHDSHVPSSSGGFRSRDVKQPREIENLVLDSREEVRIVVSFKPARGDADETFSAGRLVENIFRVTLDYVRARGNVQLGGSRNRGARERKTVLCRTRTCTSFITVSPAKLNFGEVNVGSRKSSQIVVSNRSDLTARVDLRFVSKVLSMYRDEMAIPGGQSVHLTIDYSPRRVNPSYSKQITVANLLNRRNDQVIDVRGKNVDKQRISFHSLFYRILTPHGSNFLEFGDVNINCPRVRTFAIENTSKTTLTLDISAAHPEDLGLYVKASSLNVITSSSSAASSRPPGTHANDRGAKRHGEGESGSATTHDSRPSSLSHAADPSKSNRAKGSLLKERFLETISSDAPASVRQENVSWRTAQKLSHFRKDAVPPSAVGSAKEGQLSSGKAKQPVNMIAALRKGGKGRNTQRYGQAMTFKDRTLLQDIEPLDLASGPPLVAKRISVKSKCFQILEHLESAEFRFGSASKDGVEAAPLSHPPTPYLTSEGVQADERADVSPSRTTNEAQIPSTPLARLPSPLAQDILQKAGSPSRPLAKVRQAEMLDSQKRSPALTGKKKMRQDVFEPENVADLSIDELVGAIETQPSTLSTLFFNSPQAEEKHVRKEVNLQRELKNAIQSETLVSIGMLSIPPGQERQVVAVYCPNGSTRPHIQATARKQDSRIFLRLVDYDAEAVRKSPEFSQMAGMDKEELPIRDLMVRTTACRSLLELGQPHINFGQMEKGETKVRKILIHNRSEWAESYCIRKSGSIASGDIKLSAGRYGVVPAHGKREVEFTFSPTLTGAFNEKLVIENVADRDRDLTVFLKATVHKRPNFSVEPAAIDFGTCKPGKLTEPQAFTLSNTTNKLRTFVVAVDAHDLRHQRTIMDLVFSTANEGESRAALTRAEETAMAEEIEHISQKLKIATRKGQEDKIKKYEDRLSELATKTGNAPAPAPTTSDGATDGQVVATPGEGEAALENGPVKAAPLLAETADQSTSSGEKAVLDPSRLKRVSSTVTVGVAANSSKRISLRLRTSAVHTALIASAAASEPFAPSDQQRSDGEEVHVNVRIHELKNQDETRIVAVKAYALWTSMAAAAEMPLANLGTEQTVVMQEKSATSISSADETSGVVVEQTGHRDELSAHHTSAVAMPASKTDSAPVGNVNEEEEGGEADPLPLNDGASIVFSSDSSWA